VTDSFAARRLILLKLLFTGETPMMSKVTPKLEKKERDELVREGLVRLERRGRGTVVVLTDKGWGWVAENLDGPLMVSKYASPALEAVLVRLHSFLDSRSMTLSDLFETRDTEHLIAPSSGLEGRIRAAYLSLSDGGYRRAIRIADLKQALPDVQSTIIDQTMLAMQQAGRLSLQPIEDPRAISEADSRSAIHILGSQRHLVYLEG
jgi:hypothetical protein